MLKSSLLRATQREERAYAPVRRIRYMWQNWGESDEALEARIRAMIDSGELYESDAITIWQCSDPEDDRWANMNVHARAAARATADAANPEDQGPPPTG
jgi:hypothetical protein